MIAHSGFLLPAAITHLQLRIWEDTVVALLWLQIHSQLLLPCMCIYMLKILASRLLDQLEQYEYQSAQLVFQHQSYNLVEFCIVNKRHRVDCHPKNVNYTELIVLLVILSPTSVSISSLCNTPGCYTPWFGATYYTVYRVPILVKIPHELCVQFPQQPLSATPMGRHCRCSATANGL